MLVWWPSGQLNESTPLNDAQIVALLVEELRAIAATAGPAILVLSLDDFLRIVGMLQLASRHAAVSGSNLEAAAQVVDRAREYFVTCPMVMEVINRGDDPACDRARDDTADV